MYLLSLGSSMIYCEKDALKDYFKRMTSVKD